MAFWIVDGFIGDKRKMMITINNKQYESGELVAYVEKLEKENAELKCECRRCVYTDRFCILSDFGKDRNGICDHFKDVFDEVVELKAIVRNTKAVDESFALQTIQLTKAKEIILRLYNAGRDVLMCRAEEKAYDNLSNAINDKSIEQFISEVEK